MTHVTISDYRVLFDRQAEGYKSSSGTRDYHEGVLSLTFQYANDGARDAPQYLVKSRDLGQTWSRPEPTNLPGTGAAPTGLTLPDGSLLQAARIPYPRARAGFRIDHETLHGLHLPRSFDRGRTWRTEAAIQHDPQGKPFDHYYNAMNGQFVRPGDSRWLSAFGHFDHLHERHPMLGLTIACR